MNSFLKHTPRLVLAALMVTLSGTTMSSVATTKATFTDTAATSAATFTTGTVDLSIKASTSATEDCTTGVTGNDSSALSQVFDSTIKPGTAGRKLYTICLKNEGTLPATVALSTTLASPSPDANHATALKKNMKIRIHKNITTAATGGTTGGTCTQGLATDLTAATLDSTDETSVLLAPTALDGSISFSGLSMVAGAEVKLCVSIALGDNGGGWSIPATATYDKDDATLTACPNTGDANCYSVQGASFTAAFSFTGTNT